MLRSFKSSMLFQRLLAMLLGWGTVGVAYTFSGLVQRSGTVIRESPLDRMLPFDARGVWVYLSFFAIVPAAYLFADLSRVRWLMRSMQGCALACALIFIMWPTTLVYPPVVGNSPSEAMLRLLMAGDSSQNCLPSLHAALTLLSVCALFDRQRAWRSSLVVLWGVAIGYTIIQTRRHLLLDMSAGLLLAAVSGAVVATFSRKVSS